jgi:hypothetical protein
MATSRTDGIPPTGRECANLVWIRLESALVRPLQDCQFVFAEGAHKCAFQTDPDPLPLVGLDF